jgi:hypothetical protein
MIEYYDSLEVLPLYNWDKYTTTRDNNWLIIDFNGRQPKIDNEELTALEGKLQEEYFKLVDDRTFVKKLQKWAKIDNLLVIKKDIGCFFKKKPDRFCKTIGFEIV